MTGPDPAGFARAEHAALDAVGRQQFGVGARVAARSPNTSAIAELQVRLGASLVDAGAITPAG